MQPDGSGKDALLDQLADEFAARYRRGERPSVQEYAARYPDLAEAIRELFPALVEMEQIKEEPAASGLAPTPVALQQLGDYRILREVGHGGMGIVYEAEQLSLGRHVALKVLPRKMLLDARHKRRFEREAKAAAKLHHTNIVPVFGVGEHDGLPYYAMQFIQGLGLDEVLDELKALRGPGGKLQPLSSRSSPTDSVGKRPGAEVSVEDVARSLLTGRFQADPEPTGTAAAEQRVAEPCSPPLAGRLSETAALSASSVVLPGQSGTGRKAQTTKPTYWQSVANIGTQVADALEYAHRQGILHRDIKPSNLLLDTRGTVWVTDFGLAKADDHENLTQTGDILGTLRYMPPEAFEGRTDARGDVYALGLTLYELLAFRPAFEEKDRPRLIKQVTTTEPPRLSKLNPEVPRDLETIVHKAIDRDPAHRYQTAEDLAADLQRFLDDEPIRARRLSPPERFLRWARRNKRLAALCTLSVLLLIAVAVVSSIAALQLRRERDAVLAEQQRAALAERTTLAAHVEALLTASPDSVPFLLESLKTRREEALQLIQPRYAHPRTPHQPLRLAMALAALGKGRVADLCEMVPQTPPGEASNLLTALESGDRQETTDELYRRYRQSQPGEARSRLSIALLELGDPRAAQAELALKENPSDRVRFIHLFAAWHGSAAAIAGLLQTIADPAFRSGVCLAVGGTDPALRPDLNDVFTELYTSAPDGATHSAAGWALRRRGVPLPALRTTQGPEEGRQWFVNRQGMTMIGIEPGFFQPKDYERKDGMLATVLVTRPFYILDDKVTAEMYRRFLADDHPEGEQLPAVAREGIDLHPPLASVSWTSAILFCNWLSRKEGRTPCYRPDASGRLGLTCDFRANGYRLPTDAEWEHVFRCGTTTRFVAGDDEGRLLDYGRVFATTTGPGKEFRPNSWGVFDLLGNYWELCWDAGHPDPVAGLSLNPVGPVGAECTIRGGSHDAGLFYIHGSCRVTRGTDSVDPTFRVVCGSLQPTAETDDQIALAVLTRAIERQPESPRAYPIRAEFYMRLGEWTKAEADLRRFGALKPNHLAPWYQSGWWVVGPYPEDLRASYPPEKDPNPFRPVAAVPLPGADDKKVPADLRWRTATADARGFIDLGALFDQAEHISAYALTRIYCPDKRPATILLGSDDTVRLWLNGRMMHEYAEPRGAVPDNDAVLVTLQPGWNTILAKVVNITGAHALYLRVSDEAADQVRALVEHDRWKEAQALVNEYVARHPGEPEALRLAGEFFHRRGDWYAQRKEWSEAADDYRKALEAPGADLNVRYGYALLRLQLNDSAGYRKMCATLLDGFGETTTPQVAGAVAWICTLAPEAVADRKRVVGFAEKAAASDARSYFPARTLGAALLRAGRCEEAVAKLNQALAVQKEAPVTWLLLAVAHRRLGHADEAGQWLRKAQQWLDRAEQNPDVPGEGGLPAWNQLPWQERVLLHILQREAEV
jgi:serine/threonine protein kinase/formylglycine-generating enzyme required for sulfatase activity/tetratricopeptide (TPR) repeat protein